MSNNIQEIEFREQPTTRVKITQLFYCIDSHKPNTLEIYIYIASTNKYTLGVCTSKSITVSNYRVLPQFNISTYSRDIPTPLQTTIGEWIVSWTWL
jgi:hypothetical protein